MAAVTVEELVSEVGIAGTKLNENCSQDHLASISTSVGFDWRLAAPHLGLSRSDIDDIDQEGKKEQEKRRKTLEKWIGKYGFKATYRVLVEALLKISQADLAEKVCRLLVSKSGSEKDDSNRNGVTKAVEPQIQALDALPATPEASLPGATPPICTKKMAIEEEISELEDLFEDLVDKTADGLEKANVDLPRLKRTLTNLRASTRSRHVRFLTGNLSAIINASSISEIFAILGLYWDFLNTGLLELIIRKFKDQLQDDVQKDLERYCDSLRVFRKQTTLRDFIENWTHGMPPHFAELIVEMGEDWKDKTLEDLEQFVQGIARQCTLEPFSPLLKKAKCGSVVLVFALQSSIPLSALQSTLMHEMLCTQGVLKMTYKRVCIFDHESYQKTQKLKEQEKVQKILEAYPVELQVSKKEGSQEEPSPSEQREMPLPTEVQPEQLPKNEEQVPGETTEMALDYEPRKMEKEPYLTYKQLRALQGEIKELNAVLEIKEAQLEHERNENEQFKQRVKQQQQLHALQQEEIKEASAALKKKNAHLEYERSEREYLQRRVKQLDQQLQDVLTEKEEVQKQLEHERSKNKQQQIVKQQQPHVKELPTALEAQLEHERSEKQQQQQQINQLSAALEVREAQLEHERSEKEHLQQKVNQLQRLHALQEEIKKVSTVQKQKEAQLEDEREYLQQRVKQLDRQLQDVLTEKAAAKEEKGDRARELEKQPHTELEQFNREEDLSTTPLAPSELELALLRHNIKPQYEFIEDATSPQTRIKCITKYTMRGQPRRVECDGYYSSRLQAKDNTLKKILEAESKVVPRGTAVTGVKRNKDILEEFSTKKWQKSPRYDTKSCKGGYQTTVYVPEISMATGSVGRNKQEAEDSAALAALRMLDGGDPGKLRQAGGIGDGTTSKDQPSPQGLPTDVQDTWASQELRHVTAPHIDLDGLNVFIMKLSNIIGSDWPALAQELGLTKTDIDGFREAHPHNLWEQIYQFFYKWKQQQGRNASTDKIVDGLRRAGLQELVKNMEEWSRQEQRNEMREKRLQKLDPSHSTVADSACSPRAHSKANAPPIDTSKNSSQQSPQGQFEVGDLIKVEHPQSPWYGVIQWIGQLPGIPGVTCGLEMEESREEGHSGELGGVKYFDCPRGHGLFFPPHKLKRDDRFDSTITETNEETDTDAARKTNDVFCTPSPTARSHSLDNTASTASPGRPLRSPSTGGTPVGMVFPEVEGHQRVRTSLSASFEMDNILSALKETESTPQTDSSMPGPDETDPPLGQLVFYIPADRVGMVIGRDGKNIREVEALTGTIINVDRADRYSLRQNGTVKIFGKKENCKKALLMILENLENKLDVQLATTVTMTIPNRQMTGRVIGRGGANVEAIQKLSGAKIKIEDRKGIEALLEETRICKITGSAEQIESAKELIEQAMRGVDLAQQATFAAIAIRLVKLFKEMGFEFPDVDF